MCVFLSLPLSLSMSLSVIMQSPPPSAHIALVCAQKDVMMLLPVQQPLFSMTTTKLNPVSIAVIVRCVSWFDSVGDIFLSLSTVWSETDRECSDSSGDDESYPSGKISICFCLSELLSI